MRTITRLLRSNDGTRLHLLEIGAEDAPRTLVVIHGYGEHGGRYVQRAEEWARRGFRVVVPDMRGHGRSDGRRGHVLSFSEYLDDVDTVLDHVDADPSNTVLFGHSNGGLIVIRHLLDRTVRIGAVGLSSPLLGLEIQPPKWKTSAGKVLSKIVPKISLPSEIKATMVCSDPGVVAAYDTDPLVHHVANARWYTEAVDAFTDAHGRASEIDVPTLMLQSGADQLVAPAEGRRWAASAGSAVEFEEIAGAYHELIFEPDGATHAARYADWFDKHVPEP